MAACCIAAGADQPELTFKQRNYCFVSAIETGKGSRELGNINRVMAHVYFVLSSWLSN